MAAIEERLLGCAPGGHDQGARNHAGFPAANAGRGLRRLCRVIPRIRREMLARRRSESDLREANRFLDSLIENLPVMITLKDATACVLFASTGQSSGSSEVHAAKCSPKRARFVPAEDAAPIIASDRHALESDGVVDNPDHRVHTATLGLRIFHTMKMPIRDPGGRPRYLAVHLDGRHGTEAGGTGHSGT